MDRKRTVDIFLRNIVSSKRTIINAEDEFLAELEEINQNSACIKTILKKLWLLSLLKSLSKVGTSKKLWERQVLIEHNRRSNGRMAIYSLVHWETFKVILGEIIITKTPTNFQPNPIEAHRQLALTLYRVMFFFIVWNCSFFMGIIFCSIVALV